MNRADIITQTFILLANLEYGMDLNLHTTLMNDLGLDSLEIVQLVAEVEESFNIEVPTAMLSKIKTIEDVIRTICQLKGIPYEPV